MDSFTFQEDVKTYCITASSFPEGIEEAHQRLHRLLPLNKRRNFYGVSWPAHDGAIIYKAAAEILDSDSDHLLPELEIFTIKNGPYNSLYISNYRDNLSSIKQAFDLLLQQHEVDPKGYCLEWYINENDVKCMVPLGPEYQSYTGLNKE